ncbi:MAG TPA: hypothetical protein VGH28_00475 [Polyangiaceae bacterium]|jgi:hypothetical protein
MPSRSGVVAVALVSTAAACLFPDASSLSGDGGSEASAPDAPSDAPAADAETGADADAATDAGPVCDPSKPFTSVTAISELDDGDDQYKSTVTPDELEIWYGYTRIADGGKIQHVMHASRASRSAPFGAPALEPNLTTVSVDPAVSDDGLTLFYSALGSIGNWDLFVATRPARTAAFTTPAQLAGPIQSTAADVASFVAFDGALWMSSARSGTGDIWRTPPQGGGFGSPAFVASLSSPSDETGIALTHDGLWAYVTSTRTDVGNVGGYDVFLAHRATTADDFGPLVDQSDVSSAFGDRANWISWDNCRLYFDSNRNGSNDLFVATKSP